FGELNILAGGIAIGTVINSNGDANVNGSSISATVNSAGFLRVQAGGIASAATYNSGGVEQVFGTSISATFPSAFQAVVGGTASGATFHGSVNPFVTQSVWGGGTAMGTTLSGAWQDLSLSGIAISTLIVSGGRQTISSGGTASSTTMSASSQT